MKNGESSKKTGYQPVSFPSANFDDMLKKPRHNRHGQILREDGQRTRTNILVEILRQLNKERLPDISMASVTKQLGLNAAAFYRYFSDIGEAMIAAYECVLDDARVLAAILDDVTSNDEQIEELIKFFLDTFRRFCNRHAALLRARDSFAFAGDMRFFNCRNQLAEIIAKALRQHMSVQNQPESEIALQSDAYLLFLATESAVIQSVAAGGEGKLSWPETRKFLVNMIKNTFARPEPISGCARDNGT
jgi:AcrR family transcriptional regulator